MEKIEERDLNKYKTLDASLIITSYLVLIIPIGIMLTFWFKWYISILSLSCLILAFLLVIKKIKYKSLEQYKRIFNTKKISIIAACIICLNVLSGAGGFFYQNWDYKGRNAILHDLIDYEWPVKYDYSEKEYEANKIGEKEGFLSYYFAYWLPAAAIGKILGFDAANIFLLIWQTLCTMLFFYLLCRKLNNIKLKYFLIFISFGGLDIITRLIVNKWSGENVQLLGVTHIDTANGLFCMSTFITQLFWVFNQSIPAWIATILATNDENYQNLGVFVAILLPFAPFPCLGLIILCIIFILLGFDLKNKINVNRIKELCSIQNIAAVLSVVPIGLLFLQNSSEKGSVFIRAFANGNLTQVLIGYILFLILEFGIYSIIITKKNIRRVLTYFVILAILPTFYLGGGLDLGNRATIPVLILLYIEVIIFIEEGNTVKWKEILLYVILGIAFLTNFNEFYRSVKYTIENWKNDKFIKYNDTYKTFGEFENKECDIFIKNFVAPDKNNYFKKILK